MIHATCCWCLRVLVQHEGQWWCSTPACAQRQARFATVRQDETGKVTQWLYVPTPKQAEWHARAYDPQTRYILAGGAAGPGKSRWLREALYLFATQVPGFHALLLRRTHKDLDQSHLRFMPYEVDQRGGTWRATDRVATFPHPGFPDAVIRTGHMEDDTAIQNYLSAEYDVIAPDELVTFNRDVMLELFTRARTTNVHMTKLRGIPGEDYDGALILAASNPGGRGGLWVKDFFIDGQPDRDEFPDYVPRHWAFLAARLSDNPYLKVAGYTQQLSNLTLSRKRQLLDGDWSVYEGQFFSEFRERLHVRDVGPLAPTLRHFLSLDWGFNSPGVCLWWVRLPDGHFHIRHEYKFNASLSERFTIKDVAQEIKARCLHLGLPKVPMCYGDPDLYKFKGQIAESPAETFTRWGVTMGTKPEHRRQHGWQRVREFLRVAPDGTPWLTIDPGCTYLIRTIPVVLQAKTDPDDVEDGGDDHAVDALRFGAVAQTTFGLNRAPKPVYEPFSAGWFRHTAQPKASRLLGSESVRKR